MWHNEGSRGSHSVVAFGIENGKRRCSYQSQSVEPSVILILATTI